MVRSRAGQAGCGKTVIKLMTDEELRACGARITK